MVLIDMANDPSPGATGRTAGQQGFRLNPVDLPKAVGARVEVEIDE